MKTENEYQPSGGNTTDADVPQIAVSKLVEIVVVGIILKDK